MRETDWLRLFPDDDFRWSMHLRPGDARDFFSPAVGAEEALEERGRLLQSHPGEYALLPHGDAHLIDLALNHLGEWSGLALGTALQAGRMLEPDWVLLRADADGIHRVVAGIVCFPSKWSLPEKAGLPIEAVHAPVPGLNGGLGRQIGTFLDRIAPGAPWERENWGFSADAELDHHPRNHRPGLPEDASPDSAWIRLERQLLVRLSGDSLLFGIRVSNHRLDRLIGEHPGLAPRIARSLRTMPPEAAAYKGLQTARESLCGKLDQWRAGRESGS